MVSASYTPQKMLDRQREIAAERAKRGWPYDQPVFYEYKRMARECLLWGMTRQEYLSLSEMEYHAWIEAWNELQKEGHKANQ